MAPYLSFLFTYLFCLVLALLCTKAFSRRCSSLWRSALCGFSCCGAQAVGRSGRQWFQRAGSVVVAHWLSLCAARGNLPAQGWNLCPLYWQASFLYH